MFRDDIKMFSHNLSKFPETWILPITVLFAMVAYAFCAIVFYNNEWWLIFFHFHDKGYSADSRRSIIHILDVMFWIVDGFNVKCYLCKLMLAASNIFQRGHHYDIQIIFCLPCSKMNILCGHQITRLQQMFS